MRKTCPVTGRTFIVSPEEMALRRKLGVEGEPEFHPVFRFMQLGAFWQHWNLFKRKCDRTGKSIISVFSEDCPYPVWHKDEWIKHADPPHVEPDLHLPIFPQMQELFFRCPIAHNVGTGNENCEYTDDCWYSKNCYLSHSVVECEDLRYCYRTIRLKSSQYCVFSIDSERCIDLINCHKCFRVLFAYNCWQCSDSAFLYDCRGCLDCLFCTNLRNKRYCIHNQQLTKDEYLQRRAAWDFRSRSTYEAAKADFFSMLRTRAWHRAIFVDHSEQSQGNYLDECNRCTNCYFLTTGMEDGVNVWRGGMNNRDCLDTVSPAYNTELVYNSSLPQDHCYDIRHCFNLIQCKFMEYCGFCMQCEHCFGCAGLVGKKYCIFNKPVAPEEFESRKAAIVEAMKRSAEYGKFFSGSFAANPYDESISGFYWPLDHDQADRFGFRLSRQQHRKHGEEKSLADLPDRCDTATEDVSNSIFFDEQAGRPFQIAPADIAFAKDLGVPLPYTYYARRLQENFRLIPFDGTLRSTQCGKCQMGTETSWPAEYDGRVLCEECYLKEVY